MIQSDLPTLEEIKQRRKMLNLTQQELAKESGVSQSLIAKIEGSKKYNPRYSTVTKLVQTLNRLSSKNDTVRTAGDIKTKEVVKIPKDASVKKAIDLMQKGGYSQLPVKDGGHIIGMITEELLRSASFRERKKSLIDINRYPVKQFMTDEIIRKDESTPFQEVVAILEFADAILTTKNGKVTGIITDSNVVDALSKKQ